MAKLITPAYFSDVVNAGEQRLLTFLEINLPENYIIIPNVELASTNPRNHSVQYWEYDILVIAPHAIYNIENKDWRGRLEGDDNYWYLNDHQRPNPVKLNSLKTKILHSKLKEENFNWGRARVQNVVSLSNPYQNKFGLYGDAAKLTFLLDDNLLEYITTPETSGAKEEAIIKWQEGIVNYLSGNQSKKKPEEKKEILKYEVLEILDREENYTEYLCKPKGVTSSIKFRVKEYALDVANLSPEKIKKREKQIKNQYVALNKIKQKNFFQSVEFNFDDENQFFYEITDFQDESSLRAELKKNSFTNEQRLNIIYNIISALKEAHNENIFHRDINPDNIYMSGGYAYLGNFGKAYFADHSEDDYTVMGTISEINATPYHAYELLNKDASRASDIYSLGILIYELFVGQPPVKNPFVLDQMGGSLTDELLPTSINANLPKWLDELCNNTILVNGEKRFDNLDELENFIKKANQVEEKIIEIEKPKIQVPKDSFEFIIGDVIGSYTIQKILGSGGYSKVFKVQHGIQSKEYALKLFHESVSLSSVVDEYNALKDLNDNNIVKFIWNDRINGQFYTLMEYLEGEDMGAYSKGELSLPTIRLYALGNDMLSALIRMQELEKPLIHRDIKPQNIIWDNKLRFVLIDFNVASAIDGNNDFVGTSPYIAPDSVQSDMKVNWNKSSDTFSLGITIYQLATKQFPWSSKVPSLSIAPNHPKVFNPNLSDKFADFIFKAIQPKEEDRFANAQEMKNALEHISENELLHLDTSKDEGSVVKITKSGKEENFVDYLNTLYSQSKNGNAGTRAQAVSSTYDKLTYSKTKLDKILLPTILDGAYKLVIITGNAGDGKTAFIKKIEERAKNGKRFENKNGASFDIKGTKYISNYDGSQDEDDIANDQVLEDFFSPFENQTTYNNAKEGRIIAINEGRLADFLNKSGKHTTFEKVIEDFFHEDGNTAMPDGLLIINLNLRSIIASNPENGEYSILREQITKITAPALWKKCDTCPLVNQCFIRFNVQSFNDTSAGNEIIRRLEWLIRTISYKRELHITIRDLRSFIAWMLTRDYSCNEMEDLISDLHNEPNNFWEFLYFNISLPKSDNASKDRLIKLIRETDIASTAVPSIDRDLYFAPHNKAKFISFENRNHDIIDAFNINKEVIPVYEQSQEIIELIRNRHQSYRRQHYFEGKEMYENRLPYKSIFKFHKLINVNSKELIEEARNGISKSIALNEGCDNAAAYNNYILLSSAQVKDPIAKSFRRFPLDDFELTTTTPKHLVNYLEHEADSLIFKHTNPDYKHIQLVISLDLYEMLSFIGNGFSPSLNDLRGKYIELQIFKNLLKNLEYSEVLVTKDNIEYHRISKKSSGKIKLEPINL